MPSLLEKVSVGLSEHRFPRGSHTCYIFKDDDERLEVMARFLAAGRQGGERLMYMTDTLPVDQLREMLVRAGADVRGATQAIIRPATEVYCPDGRFSSPAMLDVIRDFYEQSIVEGYRGARGTAEMSWALRPVENAGAVLEYEARLTRVLEQHPATAICQYDARRFDGSTLMDVLSIHPYMIVAGQLVANPCFIPPEEFLERYFRVRFEENEQLPA